MAAIHHDIETLLASQTTVEQQCALIKKVSAYQYQGAALAEIVTAFRAHERRVVGLPSETIDIVGTGGDGANTLNYSTMAALLLMRMGIPVAKHGSKSATSLCGSFDLLLKLGVTIPDTPEQVHTLFKEQGGVFLFAPYFHPIFKRIAAARKHFSDKGERTIFNVLGPLLNPAHVSRMVIGVYQPELVQPFAEALVALNCEYAYVVHGDGLDEASLTGPTQFAQCDRGEIVYGQWQPEDFGFDQCDLTALKGGNPAYNLQQTQAILSGEVTGPKQQMVVINAALALHASQGFSSTLPDCIHQVLQSINKRV